jgi:hypothetical protein
MTRASRLTAHHRTAQNVMHGESVTYIRNATSTELAITARKCGVRTVGADSTEVVVQTEWWDWIVTAADLVDSGATFEPDERDSIELLVDGVVKSFHLGTYGNEKCWEPADSDHTEFVVHTKLWSEA